MKKNKKKSRSGIDLMYHRIWKEDYMEPRKEAKEDEEEVEKWAGENKDLF